jgi:acyl carrier protein
MLDNLRIRDFLEEEIGVDTSDILNDSPLFSSGVIDSFALVTLITWMEKEGRFRIHPADVNLDNMDSIERLLAYAARAAG